jgi:hypothetical protein
MNSETRFANFSAEELDFFLGSIQDSGNGIYFPELAEKIISEIDREMEIRKEISRNSCSKFIQS